MILAPNSSTCNCERHGHNALALPHPVDAHVFARRLAEQFNDILALALKKWPSEHNRQNERRLEVLEDVRPVVVEEAEVEYFVERVEDLDKECFSLDVAISAKVVLLAMMHHVGLKSRRQGVLKEYERDLQFDELREFTFLPRAVQIRCHGETHDKAQSVAHKLHIDNDFLVLEKSMLRVLFRAV